MSKEETFSTLYEDSLFVKVMPLMDSYLKCKLRLQQLSRSDECIPAIKQSVKHNIQFYANRIKEIILQDSENTIK